MSLSGEQMLRVLHLIYNWGKGGFESYVCSLTERLHNRECEFYAGYSERVPMPELVEKLGIRTFHIPMTSPYDFAAAKKVAAICREYSIDAVHTHFVRERYIAAISRLMGNDAKLVYTSHVVVEKTPLLKLANRIVNRIEDNIIAVCNAGREQMLSEGLDPRKIAVIHNGVDAGFWEEGVGSTIRQEYGIGEDAFVITTTGRFNEEKGHRFLLEAACKLKGLMRERRDVKYKFLLAGDGELLEGCKRQAVDAGISEDVVFTGFRSDIRNILHGSDLYASPSKTEALSMSIIEALACALPVVATDVGGTGEVINDRNRCGLLVPYGDSDAFASAVARLMLDKPLYEEYKANARETAGKKFNLDKTALETYNLYKRRR